MYLRTFGRCVFKYMSLILLIFSALGLLWQATLKKCEVKLDFLTNINMLLMIEKRNGGGICQAINCMEKLMKNTWKIMIKTKNCNIWSIGMQIIYIDGQCHKSCLEMTLNGLKIFLNLMKISLKATVVKKMKDIFLSRCWISWKYTLLSQWFILSPEKMKNGKLKSF